MPRPARARAAERPVRLLALAPLLVLAVLLGDAVGIVRGPSRVADCTASTALVMGAAQYDGRPSPALERRLARALALYNDGCVERIVVSGGGRPGDRSTEGAAGVAWLEGQGVPRDRLAAETKATNSVENILLTRPLVRGASVLIVTDDLHAWRSAWLAERFGMDASAVGVPSGPGRLGYLGRELAAMAAYRAGWLR